MNILLSGSSGLIGSALVDHLRKAGHKVIRLVRRPSDAPDTFVWNPEGATLDLSTLGEIDSVVHLAGAPIAAKRWSPSVKRRILESRVHGTRLLAEALARLPQRPEVLVSASGVGIYGHRGEAALDESCSTGAGFLADVAEQWEAATAPAAEAGVRVVMMRLGMVLSKAGGALPRMLTPFRWGLGGPIGSGRQYLSWITLDDAVAAMRYVLESDVVTGPVNTVAPTPVTNRAFAHTLARLLQRPCLFPLPAPVVTLLLGQMGRELLLASTRAVPGKLTATGFSFQYPELDDGLRHVLYGR